MEAYAYIRALAAKGTLGHAYLITGGSAKTRAALADFLAAALLCSGEKDRPCGVCSNCRKLKKDIHPDLLRVRRQPEKREILVEQARALAGEAALLPNEAARKLFVIEEADTMNLSAQNTLLKLLEEPPSAVCFLLLGENPGSFLSTVRSRCVELHAPDGAEKASAGDETAARLAEGYVTGDRLGFAAAAFPCEKYERERFDRLLESLYAAAALRARAAGPQREAALRLAADTVKLQQMRKVYVSPGHCLGWLLSNIEDGQKGSL